MHVGNQLMGQGGRGELRGLNYCLPLTGREDVEEVLRRELLRHLYLVLYLRICFKVFTFMFLRG